MFYVLETKNMKDPPLFYILAGLTRILDNALQFHRKRDADVFISLADNAQMFEVVEKE